MEGNPLFEFEFTPVSEQQWMRRVQKTVHHAKLQQLRDPEDTDDMVGGHHQDLGRGDQTAP